MDKIFIFGHKKPDTDSVVSAIALSYLKNKLGLKTVPTVLGDINNETKFVLDYFKVPAPNYLNDVKLQIKDLNYKRDYFVFNDKSILQTYKYMSENYISNVPVIDQHKNFLGIVAMKDIARDMISGDFENLHTSYDHILEVLEGKEVLRFDNEIVGKIMVASFKSTTFIQNVKLDNSTILIVGDRHSIIEYAVNSGVKIIIVTGSNHIKDEHIEIAKKNKVNIIKTNFFSFKASKLIGLSNYISDILNNNNIIYFDESDNVNDFVEQANRTRYSYFPVINKSGKCLGIIKLSDIVTKNKKKVILVDHNAREQSVEGLEEADIIEVIDHHNIGSIGTSMPINFRNMPVGSTCTILHMLYKENNIEIPKHIAGLMVSGILSDTLLFASPTTTDLDRKIVPELAEIAGIDYKSYAMEMFKAGSSLKGKTFEEILYNDFKNFTIDDKKVGIGQVSTVNVEEILKDADSYIELIDKVAINNNYYIVALFVTDIINNGSYMYYNKKAESILDNCFNLNKVNQGIYLDGIISRKKQVIPSIMGELEKK